MAAASSDSSESSSSSSSSDEEGAGVDIATPSDASKHDDDAHHDEGDAHHDEGDAHHDEGDARKAFLSRVPQTFTDESIKMILEGAFGGGCVEEVSVVCERPDEDAKDTKEDTKPKRHGKEEEAKHRGFGFVTFASESACQSAIEAGTVRGSAKPAGKRKHTLYIRPVVREERDSGSTCNKNVCFLWKKNRCPYGDDCKFAHEGEGGCLADATAGEGGAARKKKQKCFNFKRGGKCKLGDECPYSHDIAGVKPKDPVEGNLAAGKEATNKADKSQKDCINWKNKGKCRKGDRCPYRHDPSVREKVLAKKQGRSGGGADQKKEKNRQSLSVRVFGLNYDTTEDDIRSFFAPCGSIMEVTFPTFEDSGRSKGYCGVLFQSPKAVALAVELDGTELHGRWLRIQEGKMYLRQWEEREKEREAGRKGGEGGDEGGREERVGEYGQRVKRRKRHGFKE